MLLSYFGSIFTFILGVTLFLKNEKSFATILFVFTLTNITNLVYLYISHSFYRFSNIQHGLILIMPFIIYSFVGTSISNTFVVMWGIISPISALVIHGYKRALIWFIDYLVLLFVVTFINYSFSPIDSQIHLVIHIQIFLVSIIIYLFFLFWLKERKKCMRSLIVGRN